MKFTPTIQEGTQDAIQEGAQALQEVGSGNVGFLSNFWNSYWGSMIALIGQAVLGLLVVIVLVGVWYKYWYRYDISVTLWRSTAGGGKQSQDTRAMIVKDDQGKRKLQLLSPRDDGDPVTCPVPDSEYKTLKQSWMGTKPHYDLEMDDAMQLHPVKPQLSSDLRRGDRSKMRTEAQERRAWANLETKNLEEKYQNKSWLERHKDMAMTFFALVMIMLIAYFGFSHIGSGLSEIGVQLGEVARVCKNLGA